MEEKILAALREKGPMTSHDLCEALGLEWTEFSSYLLNMIRDDFHSDGSVLRTHVARGYVYHLPDQQV